MSGSSNNLLYVKSIGSSEQVFTGSSNAVFDLSFLTPTSASNDLKINTSQYVTNTPVCGDLTFKLGKVDGHGTTLTHITLNQAAGEI